MDTKDVHIAWILNDAQEYINGEYPKDSYMCIIFMYGDYVLNIMSLEDILSDNNNDYFEVVCHMEFFVKDGEPYMDKINEIAEMIEFFISDKKALELRSELYYKRKGIS